MIKGHVTIDLHNHRSGFKERIEKDNLVTDAVGILASVYAGANMTDKIMPLATKALGGLMLFDGALQEEKSNIFFPSHAHLIGFAGQWTNTENPLCGSLNIQETHATDTGYETVWDFSTSQANGTIASLSLTAAPESGIKNNPLTGIDERINFHNVTAEYAMPIMHSSGQIMYGMKDNGIKTERDAERNIYKIKAGVTINKWYMPLTEYKVTDAVNWTGEQENVKDIELEVESVRSNIFDDSPRIAISNGYDGYAYLFFSDGNDDGDGQFSYNRIKLSDFSFDVEGPVKVTLPGIRLKGGIWNGVICRGKCFMTGKDERHIYIVDLANTADVKTADLGEGPGILSGGRFMSDINGTVHIKRGEKDSNNNLWISDAVVYPDGEVRINIPYNDNNGTGTKRYNLCTESLVAYGIGGYGIKRGNRMANYLGTICNLATPVTKTASTSMKITYTLTDEAAV